MKKLKNICIVLMLLVISVNAKDNYEIQWQLENPFRFFKNPEIYESMKELYKEAKLNQDENSTSLAFERLLHSKKWHPNHEDNNTLGWAKYFSDNQYTDTYWNQSKMEYRQKDEYIYPKKHNIVVNLNSIKDEMCFWYLNGNKVGKKVRCSDKKTLTIPYDKKSTKISVSIAGREDVVPPIKIKIRDILIVGLGDSFGSGEGNPDMPVQLNNKTINFDFIGVKNRYFPRKNENQSAKWLDKRAHRSLYSYQFKAALEYSFKNPKQAVTFVSFSTSGAKTENILDEPKAVKEPFKEIKSRYYEPLSALEIWEGKEDNSTDRAFFIRPQIELLDDVLKNEKKENRKADILLLSIGGNDIGFGAYVGNILSKTGLKSPNKKTSYKVDTILFKNYNMLNNRLKKYVKNENSSRIVFTAYPHMLHDENNNTCKGDRRAFVIPFGVSSKREQRILDTEKYLIEPLYKIQKNLASELGWTFVDNHRNKFLPHGFCAKNTISSSPIQEQFVMPHKYNKKEEWIPFSPVDYRAYGKKQRWVQLPVDSILMINLTKKFLWFDTDFGLSDETSGILHPTADGLAVEADENVKVMGDILLKLKENKNED